MGGSAPRRYTIEYWWDSQSRSDIAKEGIQRLGVYLSDTTETILLVADFHLLSLNDQNVIINKTRIEDNSEDIKELKKEIREGFNKIDDKLDKLVNSNTP